jgi:hypothetical protein
MPTETHVNRAMRTVSELPFTPAFPVHVDMAAAVGARPPSPLLPVASLLSQSPTAPASWAALSQAGVSLDGGFSRLAGGARAGRDMADLEAAGSVGQCAIAVRAVSIAPGAEVPSPYQHQIGSSSCSLAAASEMGCAPRRKTNWPERRCSRRTRSTSFVGLCNGRQIVKERKGSRR